MELIEPKPIDDILKAVGVQRVVAIDDIYADRAPVEDLISAIDVVPAEVSSSVLEEMPQIDFAGDVEVRNAQLRESWREIDIPRRVQLLEELRAKGSEADDTDKITKDSLGPVFTAHNFIPLSLAEWNTKKDEILKDQSIVLLLIDEDFTKEGGTETQGLDIVTEILSTTAATHVLCGLLSHKYKIDDIHGQWERLCDERGFDKSRFVLIPKRLIDDDPAAFAALVKLAIIAKPIDELRNKTTDVLLDALGKAEQQIRGIDVYDMDEIVFRSSWKEGVWEPETLVRIFAIFHRAETRKLAMSNTEIHSLAAQIRRVSHASVPSKTQPDHRIWPIQHLELYDASEYINALHLPIELGDIFQKDGGRLFVLIAPSCDLIVRSNGTRSIREATLAEITLDERPNCSWEMPFYEISAKHYVNFKKTSSVKLFGLDLCAFNASGVATCTVGAVAPTNLIPAWERRFYDVSKEAEAVLAAYERLSPSPQQKDDAARWITRIDNHGIFTGNLNLDQKVITYNFKRTGRLLQPRSGALLVAYAQFLSRPAFEHEFDTVPLPAAPASKNRAPNQ